MALLALLCGCSAGVDGDVRDAGTGAPVVGALVEVADNGWGVRDGQLVWDKTYRHTARSGPDGRFLVEGVDGGHGLTVRASGYPTLETSLCSRSPMTVRVGGRFEGSDLDRQLRLGETASRAPIGWSFASHTSGSDLSLVSAAGESHAALQAPGGMAFVSGTGNPPMPPAGGYRTRIQLDLLQCGWLFVRFAGGVAAVRIGSMAVDEPLEGGRHLLLSYGIAGKPRSSANRARP